MTTKEHCPISFRLSLPFGYSVLTTSNKIQDTHVFVIDISTISACRFCMGKEKTEEKTGHPSI